MTHNIDGENTHDAFDDAMRDDPVFFAGQVMVDAYTCVSHKGHKREPYNPAVHQGLNTASVVSFNIAPLDPTRRMITREMIDWDRSYKGVVRPSIETLTDQIATIRGVPVGSFNPLREISNLFVTGEFVPKPDNKTGETWTTLQFIGVFAAERECKSAYDELIGETSETEDAPVDDTSQAERASLAAFLPSLWEQANHDVEKMSELLAVNPMLAKHFDATSPEVKELIDADPSQDVPI